MGAVTTVLRLDAYPDRLTAKVGAEQKTLRNCETAIIRQTEYLKSLTTGPKEVLVRLKKERDESKVRLAKARKALAG